MEAKDTVMKIEELLDIEEAVEDAVFSGQETDTKPVAIAKAQAITSFRAGIREVVGWVNQHCFKAYTIQDDYNEWQAKLKEWGIK